MSNSFFPQRLSHSVPAVALTGITVSLVLAGCSAAPKSTPVGAQSKPATSAPAPSATPSQIPAVIGHLDVEFIKVTRTATLPQQPIRYMLTVRKVGQSAEVEFPVEANGDFSMALAPGSYDLPFLTVEAADSEYPLKLPMANTATLRVKAHTEGCVYAGQIHLRYGRLPAGTLEQQTAMMQKVVQSAGHNMAFGYLSSGGIVVMDGGETTIAPPDARPIAAKDCAVEEFTSVPA